MTKTRSRLALAAVSLIVPLVLPFSAQADEFAFNRNIGKVYVRNVTVESIGDETATYSITIHTPYCRKGYRIEGLVQLTYTSSDHRSFTTEAHTFSGSREEDVDITYSGSTSVSLSDTGGVARVRTNSECVPRGDREAGGHHDRS